MTVAQLDSEIIAYVVKSIADGRLLWIWPVVSGFDTRLVMIGSVPRTPVLLVDPQGMTSETLSARGTRSCTHTSLIRLCVEHVLVYGGQLVTPKEQR